MNNIDIVLSSDNNYAQHCAVLIASILLNNKNKYRFNFHILDGGISSKNKHKISELNRIQDFSITYYSMNNYDFSFLPLNRKNISISTYYRLMLTSILPEDINKIIYLDCDIIVDGDISEFWETDISDVFAGVIEDESSIRSTIKLGLNNYFNAGVLLLNVKKLRETNFIEAWLKYFKENELIIDLQDQDILNGVFNNNVKWLPLKWNANATLFSDIELNHFYSSEDAKIAKDNRVIIHYTERYKPWSKKCYHPLRKLYFKYLLYTPYKLNIVEYIIIKLCNVIKSTFSITNINNRRHKQITILGIKFKFRLKNRLNNFKSKTNVAEYIHKYKYILTENVDIKPVPGFDNVIWSCWLQGIENAPLIVKYAINTIIEKNPKLKLIIITAKNMDQYIEIPSYIKKKHEEGIISNTHLSDYIRLCLLQKYGGTWVDATCCFTEEIPENILNSEFFQFVNYTYCSLKSVPSANIQKFMRKFSPNLCFTHTGSSWFLHAKPNNSIINKTKQLIEAYWYNEDHLVDYFLFHYFLTFAVQNNESCRNIFNMMPKYNNIYPHLLQKCLYEKFNEILFDDICQNSFVHKLTYKGINYAPSDNFLNYLLQKIENKQDFLT